MNLTFDQTISILGQFATWVTLIIIYLTLREMKSQRKASYKPELIPTDLIFTVFSGGTELFTWINGNIEKDELQIEKGELPNKINNCLISIHNIGLGSAKNIKVSWIYDFEKAVDFLSQLDFSFIYKNINISISDKRLVSFNIVDLKNNSLKMSINCSNKILDVHKEFLFPFTSLENKFSLNIPLSYIIIRSMFISYFYQEINQTHTEPIDDYLFNQPITLKIDYEDIEGNNYSKFYICQQDFFMYKGNKDGKFLKAIGYLKFDLD